MFSLSPHPPARPKVLVVGAILLAVVALFTLSIRAIRGSILPPEEAASSPLAFDGGKMGSGPAGSTQSYLHTLTNDTALTHTFHLTAISSEGFTVSVAPLSVTVASGASAEVTLFVTIPDGTASGILDITTLTARTQPPAPSVTRRASATTLVSAAQALTVPPLQQGAWDGEQRSYTLTMQSGSTEFWPGLQTPTYGYNGSYLGPTLEFTRGETIFVSVTNALPELTTNHWHGLHLPPKMDGGPHQGIEVGTTWTPTWTVDNEAATMWYHPHPHATHHLRGEGVMTGEQVYRGLAGMILIRDSKTDALELPERYGVDEFPIIIQDRRFNTDGSFDVETNILGQRKGDAFLVNGTLAGELQVPAQMVRLHLLNGSNFRFYSFGFSDNRTFYQIASDSAMLTAPVARTRALMAPGERIEIVVDLSDAQGQTLHFAAFNEELGNSLASIQLLDPFDQTNFILFSLVVGAPTSDPVTTLPESLNTIIRIPRSAATVEYRLELTSPPPSINNQTFDMETINITSTLDTIEVWAISNSTQEAHPIHLHGSPFQVLMRGATVATPGQPLPQDGELPADHEMGWKDTIIVYPGERVDIIKGVYDFSDASSPFMYHCHLLEHEDDGMMGQYIVRSLDQALYLPLVLD